MANQPSPFNDALNWYNSLPTVTRSLFTLSIGTTLLGNLGLVSPRNLILIGSQIWKKFELWRLVTCFFFEKLGFPYLLNLYFLYRNSLELETSLFQGRTADYVTFVLFCMVNLLVFGFSMGYFILGEGLVMSIIYLWSMYNRDKIVNFMFGMQFQAMYLPWVLIAWDFLTGGGISILKIVGVIVGHLYYFLDKLWPEQGGQRFIQTPSFLLEWFPPQRPTMAGVSGQAPTRPQPQRGAFTGAGHRLGD